MAASGRLCSLGVIPAGGGDFCGLFRLSVRHRVCLLCPDCGIRAIPREAEFPMSLLRGVVTGMWTMHPLDWDPPHKECAQSWWLMPRQPGGRGAGSSRRAAGWRLFTWKDLGIFPPYPGFDGVLGVAFLERGFRDIVILSCSWCLDNCPLQEGSVGGKGAPGGGGGGV